MITGYRRAENRVFQGLSDALNPVVDVPDILFARI
jgi:hypothetical protein